MKPSPKAKQFLRTHQAKVALEKQITKLQQKVTDHEEYLEQQVHLLTEDEYKWVQERIREGGR